MNQMFEIIKGDLLESDCKYIAHQCNCISKNSAGIAKDIFNKFPYANTYSDRGEPDNPGTIKIVGDGQEQRYIINMYAQYYPGKSKYPDAKLDGILTREQYFYKCLGKIAKIPDLESIGFPWMIGCGIAGGDWAWYLGQINIFTNYIEKKQNAKVIIYHLDGDE